MINLSSTEKSGRIKSEILTEIFASQTDKQFIFLPTKLIKFFGTIIRVHLQPK